MTTEDENAELKKRIEARAIKHWSHHSPILTIRVINLMLAEARATNLGAVTSAYGIPEETIGRPQMKFTVNTEQEADGRWIAKNVGPFPVESVYGATRDEAIKKAGEAALKAYSMLPEEPPKFTEWGIVFERGTICSATEQPKMEGGVGVLTSRMIASSKSVACKSVVNPARFRDTEMVCSICHRQFREHAFQEFGDCWTKIYGETSLSDARWPPSWPPGPPQK